MVQLALSCALAGILFSPQDFHEFPIEAYRGFTGTISTNFRHLDVNSDGRQDLCTNQGILLQGASGFDTQAVRPFPEMAAPAILDLWGNRLYLIDREDNLRIVAMTDDQWALLRRDTLESFPHNLTPLPAEPTTHVQLRRVLCDTDSDGVPEICTASPEGLLLYAEENGRYGVPRRLSVLPPVRTLPESDQQFYPATARDLTFPGRQMICRLAVSGQTITVFEWEPVDTMHTIHRITTHPLHAAENTQDAADTWQSTPLREHIRPYRLNDDAVFDFAGARWERSDRLPAPAGILETSASLDGGMTFSVRRTLAFRTAYPQTAFLDFDADGDIDMITQETGAFQGGIKEMLTRFLAATRLDHEYRVYQQVRGRFADSPICVAKFTLVLDGPPVEHGPMFTRIETGQVLNPVGDFNGDGYRDVLVWDAPESASVFLAQGFSYPSDASAKIQVPPSGSLDIADVDKNGRDDILLHWTEQADQSTPFPADPQAESLCRVFFSQEAVP